MSAARLGMVFGFVGAVFVGIDALLVLIAPDASVSAPPNLLVASDRVVEAWLSSLTLATPSSWASPPQTLVSRCMWVTRLPSILLNAPDTPV
ncbi:hypothetical protein [Actinomadura logoneensis]|nr:hypothetical protein [Actinomadura logoneensis]